MSLVLIHLAAMSGPNHSRNISCGGHRDSTDLGYYFAAFTFSRFWQEPRVSGCHPFMGPCPSLGQLHFFGRWEGHDLARLGTLSVFDCPENYRAIIGIRLLHSLTLCFLTVAESTRLWFRDSNRNHLTKDNNIYRSAFPSKLRYYILYI